MSTGPHITDRQAWSVVRRLADLWPLGDYIACGSLRRGSLSVGDIDLVTALPAPGEADVLYDRIAQDLGSTIPGTAIRGVRENFKCASLILEFWGPAKPTPVAVQISRYAPLNKGWTIVRCTGPREFGVWFLGRWKQRYNIAPDRQASVEGHLVDAAGAIIPVRSESECFERLGIEFIDPENRAKVASRCA